MKKLINFMIGRKIVLVNNLGLTSVRVAMAREGASKQGFRQLIEAKSLESLSERGK